MKDKAKEIAKMIEGDWPTCHYLYDKAFPRGPHDTEKEKAFVDYLTDRILSILEEK